MRVVRGAAGELFVVGVTRTDYSSVTQPSDAFLTLLMNL